MGEVRTLRRLIGLLVAATASVGIALAASSFAGAQQAPTQGTIIVEKQLIPDGYKPPQGGFVFRGAIQATLGDGQSASAKVDPGHVHRDGESRGPPILGSHLARMHRGRGDQLVR